MTVVLTLPEKIKNITKRENIIIGEFLLPTGEVVNLNNLNKQDWYTRSLMNNYLRYQN